MINSNPGPETYQRFLDSQDTLWVYKGALRVFTSNEDLLSPLLKYIASSPDHGKDITIFDKIMGNAAALLSVLAGAKKVYSPLGSEIAVKTLKKYDIDYQTDKIVDCIKARDGVRMCPMEKLSLDKTPEELYKLLRKKFDQSSIINC